MAFNSRIDYHIPIDEKWETNAGTQYYFRNSKDNYYVDNNFESLFKYSDKIVSAYGSVKYSTSHDLSFQTGIRFENVFTTINDSVKNTNFNFMPTLSVGYKINEKNLLRLNISRKSVYPAYRDLSSHTIYSIDSMNITKGNPYLKPLNELSFGVEYKYMGNIAFMSFSPSYSLINNTISTKYTVMSDGIIEADNFNLSKTHRIGGMFELDFDVFYFESGIYYDFFPNREHNGFSITADMGAKIDLPFDFYIDMNITLKDLERKYNYVYEAKPSLDYFLIGRTFFKGTIEMGIMFMGFLPKIEKDHSTTMQKNYKNEWYGRVEQKEIMFRFRYSLQRGKKLQNRNIDLYMESGEPLVPRR